MSSKLILLIMKYKFVIILGKLSGCLDVCATPQLGTVTLRPALSDTVTIRPMSCCGLVTQLHQYD